jgi:hypothetical protein
MDRFLVIFVAGLTLAGCGSASSGRTTSNDYYLDYCSPGGIWRAADGTVAIIDETPRAHLVQPDGVQFFGTLDGEGSGKTCWLDTANSTLHLALPIGLTLPDGATAADGHVNGDWYKRQGIMNISGSLRTATGALTLSFDGAYDPLHGRESDIALVAGSYRPSGSAEEVVTIDPQGGIFGQNSANGCVVNGTIVAVNTRYNVYRVEASYASCTGSAVVLNGNAAKGLGYLDSSKSPAELSIALEVSGTTQHYSVVKILQRI